jgi:hypothetical protein
MQALGRTSLVEADYEDGKYVEIEFRWAENPYETQGARRRRVPRRSLPVPTKSNNLLPRCTRGI